MSVPSLSLHPPFSLCPRTSWDELLQQVDARDQKLQGAGEIHRFNRDVEDALSRIQEKYAAIPEDLGRDTKAVQGYLKKHEGFENELVALEAQVSGASGAARWWWDVSVLVLCSARQCFVNYLYCAYSVTVYGVSFNKSAIFRTLLPK